MSDWRAAVLKSLGAPATPANMKFLTTWQRWEGGHTNNSAKFNWLNTTTGDGPKINSVGVKRFKSFQEGVMNTVRTLQNGRYDDIVGALAKGDPYGNDVSGGLQTWVSGRPDGNPAYARKVLGGEAAPPVRQRAKAAAQRLKAQTAQARQAAAQSPNAAWDEAMKLIFEDDPEMGEILAQSDDVVARESGLVDPGGSLQGVDLDGPEVKNGGALKLTQVASTQLGKPYVFGSGPDTASFDCSDLIQWAYKQIGIRLPRVTTDQIKVGRSVKGQKLQPGDLVFPDSGHVVMYVGDGKVIAAPRTGTVVQYQPLSRWKSLLDVRRVL